MSGSLVNIDFTASEELRRKVNTTGINTNTTRKNCTGTCCINPYVIRTYCNNASVCTDNVSTMMNNNILGNGFVFDNANRDVAIQKFNSEEQTAVNEFNANADNARQVFNSQMQNIIDRSNATWRRQINTTNTANDNRASQQNAQVLLGLTVQAQNNLWQEYRDVAHQLYSSYENDRQRTHDIVVTGIKNQFSSEQFQNMLDYRASVAAGARINGYVEKLIGPVIGRGVEKGLGKLFSDDDDDDTGATWASAWNLIEPDFDIGWFGDETDYSVTYDDDYWYGEDEFSGF